MPTQILKGQTFGDSSPDNIVTKDKLHALIDNATVLKGSITEQTAITATASGDQVLLTDASDSDNLKKCALSNLPTEAQRHDVPQYAAGVLGSSVYAVTLSPAATAYTAGMVVRFKADSANVGAVDINVSGLGDKNLYKRVSTELAADDILASQVVTAVYDGTNFQVTNDVPVPAASVTAAMLDANFIGDLSAKATPIAADLVPIGDSADSNNTKKATLASLWAAGASATANFYASAETAYGNGLVIDAAHGLSATPTRVWAVIKCDDAGGDQGYAENDIVPVEFLQANDKPASAPGANATNAWISMDNTNVKVLNKSATGWPGGTLTAAKWKVILYAAL